MNSLVRISIATATLSLLFCRPLSAQRELSVRQPASGAREPHCKGQVLVGCICCDQIQFCNRQVALCIPPTPPPGVPGFWSRRFGASRAVHSVANQLLQPGRMGNWECAGLVRAFRFKPPPPRLNGKSTSGSNRWEHSRRGLPTLGFALLIVVVATVASGLAPAFFSVRGELNNTLNEGGRSGTGGARSHKLRGLLVGIEVALVMVALVGAGLRNRDDEASARITSIAGMASNATCFFEAMKELCPY